MAATTLRKFLNSREVDYVAIQHAPVYTAVETAERTHVPGRDFAKSVIVETAGGRAMVVLPADRKIVLSDLREMLGDPDLKLASESEFIVRFPDCEFGAIPPFGNLYGLPVYIAESLAHEPEIAFNAGNHREVFKLSYEDYAELVQPVVLDFATV